YSWRGIDLELERFVFAVIERLAVGVLQGPITAAVDFDLINVVGQGFGEAEHDLIGQIAEAHVTRRQYGVASATESLSVGCGRTDGGERRWNRRAQVASQQRSGDQIGGCGIGIDCAEELGDRRLGTGGAVDTNVD